MRSNCQHLLDHSKSNRVPEKTSTSVLLVTPKWITTTHVDHNKQSGSQQTVENSSIDGSTRPPDLPPEKTVC